MGEGRHWRRRIERCDAVMSLGGNRKRDRDAVMSFGGNKKKGIGKYAFWGKLREEEEGRHWRRRIERCDAVMSLGGNKKGIEKEALGESSGEMRIRHDAIMS